MPTKPLSIGSRWGKTAMPRSGVLAAVFLLAAAGSAGSAPAQTSARESWVTAWAQSQQGTAGQALDNQSMRMISHLSQGGSALRIRVQNTFGTAPLTIDHATVGHSGQGADLLDTALPVTFGGQPNATIPPGGELWSDETALATKPQDNVAVSMHIAGTAVPGQHSFAARDNYLTPPGAGDHTADGAGSAYTQTVGSTYLVSAVDVQNSGLKGTVVGFGSSVVDGVGSTNCGPGCTETGTDKRWLDDLGRRITAELPPDQQLAVANAGINGTTSSAECPSIPPEATGLDALARLDRDVLALHGVTDVIYYYGTNDLAAGCDAAQILSSYQQVFQRLRDAGIAVHVTPITPRPSYTDQQNLDRHEVGTFVKRGNSCGGTCTDVADFDQVLKDPLNPNGIYPPYDSGDGVHANIAGQQALADYLWLSALTEPTTK